VLEVPVGYTISVESSLDPSHAQFLHEGIAGFSPERAVPMQNFELLGEISEAGFTLKHSGYNISNQDMEATRKFTPPCSNTTLYKYPNGTVNLFQLYFVPTKPGHCKYITKFLSDNNPPTKRNFYYDLLPKYLQAGLCHSSSYKLNDQDLSMMHSQAINESIGNRTWKKSYFMPSLADIGIVTFRKWLDEFAGGQPAWQGVTEAPFQKLSDEQLYDIWNRHTKQCPNCQQSLVLVDKIRERCQIFAVALAALALFLTVINLPTHISLVLLALGLLSLIFSYQLIPLRERFISSIPKTGLPIVKLY
jgi:phenylpropionate dioxygenase-like ring-hydroxylating dioxygenase large terminal subunit